MRKLLNFMVVAGFIYSFSSSLHASNMSIDLNPRASKSIENNFGFEINATCQIQCANAANKIRISVVKNTSVVNGRNLAVGQAASFTVHNNDSITVSAEPGAKVNLVNLGHTPVHANCSA